MIRLILPEELEEGAAGTETLVEAEVLLPEAEPAIVEVLIAAKGGPLHPVELELLHQLTNRPLEPVALMPGTRPQHHRLQQT